eukprot:4092241-Amphidinium_carterae.2
MSHFVQGQPFSPPMSHEDLLRNIENGISIPSGSKVRNLEDRRLRVLQGLMAPPEEPGASGSRVGVPGEGQVEVGTSGSRAGVPPILCVPSSGEQLPSLPGAPKRSASVGKRTLEQIGEPPGLGNEEAKARRIQNIYSLDIQTHVEVLQQIVQRFDIQVTNNVSTQEVQIWVRDIWSVLGEVTSHLHSVSHFTSQGLDQQGLHCQSLQNSVDVLDQEIKLVVSELGNVAKTTENLQKQYEHATVLRGRVDKLQLQMSGVLSLLEGVRTPLTEAFSGIYEERKRVNNLTLRVEQLELAGVSASDKDLNLDGSPLMDQSKYEQLEKDLKQLIEERSVSQIQQYSAVDVRLQTLARELERTKTDLINRQEESGSMFRKETMKFRDEIQTRFGNDLDQRVRKQIEQYVTTASGAEGGVRIELYAKALSELKESQKQSDQRCKSAEERCDRLVTKHLDTVARLEKTIRDLFSRQVKDQKVQGTRPTGRGRSSGESGSPRTVRQTSRAVTPDSEAYLGGTPAPLETVGAKLRQSNESSAFSLKANRESPSLGEIATDTEGSWIEEIFLEPIRRSLVGEAESGSIKVYTNDDHAFKVHDVVIFQDLHHNVEAHRVAGHGSLILDGPLRGSFPPGSEVRTMMGTERVYTNGTHSWIGNAGGMDYIAPLYGAEQAPRTPEQSPQNQDEGTPPRVPKFGASQQDSGGDRNTETKTPGPGVASTANPGIPQRSGLMGVPEVLGSTLQPDSGSLGASGSRVGAPQTNPGTSQVRDVSPPVSPTDDLILG